MQLPPPISDFTFDLQRFDNPTPLTQESFTNAGTDTSPVKLYYAYQLDAGSYQLDGEITLDKPLMIYGDVTLDLNGHNLNLGSNSISINDDCSLTVEDSDSEKKGTIWGTNPSIGAALIAVGSNSAGTFTLKSGNITITGTKPAVQVNAGGSTVNIEGGKITAQNIGINVESSGSSTVNITGGEIHVSGTGDNVYAVKDNNNNTIKIEGGTITSSGSYAITSKGSVTVDGGMITSASENNFKALNGQSVINSRSRAARSAVMSASALRIIRSSTFSWTINFMSAVIMKKLKIVYRVIRR